MSRTISPSVTVNSRKATGPSVFSLYLVQQAPGMPFRFTAVPPRADQRYVEMVEFSDDPGNFISTPTEV